MKESNRFVLESRAYTMFTISGKDLNSAAQLKKGLQERVRRQFGACEVTLEDREFPSLKLVRIDLSGGRIDAGNPPPVPAEFREKCAGITTDRLEIGAKPLHVEGGGHIRLRLTAKEIELRLCEDAGNREWLAPHRAAGGHVEFEIDRDGMRSLFLGGALRAAEKHGIKIEETDLKLSPHGEDNVQVEARIIAKKMFTVSIVLTGRMRLDAKMQAHFSDLSCHGGGAIGHMVSAFLGPKLRELESKPFPLMGFRMGEIRLQNAKLTVLENGTLNALAKFGE